jgi:hypothetical protein
MLQNQITPALTNRDKVASFLAPRVFRGWCATGSMERRGFPRRPEREGVPPQNARGLLSLLIESTSQ